MRMRRKKHLEERLDQVSDRIINLWVDTVRFDADEAPKHLNFRELFGNDNPVEMEIGCGKGGFICELAARHPEINFLAVEVYANVLVTACEEAQDRGLTNLHFLWGMRSIWTAFSRPTPLPSCISTSPPPSPKSGRPPIG